MMTIIRYYQDIRVAPHVFSKYKGVIINIPYKHIRVLLNILHSYEEGVIPTLPN